MKTLAHSVAHDAVADDAVAADALANNEVAASGLADGGVVVLDAWLGSGPAMALRAEVVLLLDEPHSAHVREAGMGGLGDHVVSRATRRDRVCWFDALGIAGRTPGVEVTRFLRRLDGLVLHLNRTCFLGIERVECHAACFDAGAFYGEHLDTLRHDDRRMLSYCYYLNDTWTEAAGGCLRMAGSPPRDVAPLLDRLVVFRSDTVRHEVLPTMERRFSLTGWLSRAPAAA